MHGYCSTCINILVFFSLSLFLSFSLVLSAHSPSRFTLRDQHHDCRTKNSIDQHHITAADQHHTTAADQHQTTRRLIKSPPITLPSISIFLIWSRSNHCSRWTRWSRSNHYCRSTSNHCHTPPDQIAANHSPLNLRFSHLIKIKTLSPMNSLIKIKPLSPINIKPLPHAAWSNRRRSTHWFLVGWSVGFGLGGWWFGFRIEWVSA